MGEQILSVQTRQAMLEQWFKEYLPILMADLETPDQSDASDPEEISIQGDEGSFVN
jgi:hypothetical protein